MAEHNNHSMHHGGDQLIVHDEEYRKEFENPQEAANLDKNKNVELECYQSLNVCCGSCTGCLAAWLPCFCFCFNKPFVQVPQSYKGVVQRFGKPISVIDPGLHQINTCTDQVLQVSLKTRILELPQQTITTKDNITLFVDAVIYFRVIGILRAIYSIENLEKGLRDQSIASVRSVLGEMNLQNILDSKEELAVRLEVMINQISKRWGTIVEDVFFKDIALNKETQSDMAATAKQRRLGETKLISNKAEVEAATLLRQTADILDSKAAMQVRYLEVIQNITKATQDQVIFLPLNPTAGTVNGGGYNTQNKK